MATLHPSRNDAAGPNVHAAVYPRAALMTELDFQDNRYPTLHSKNTQRASTLVFGSAERSGWENSSNGNDGLQRRSYEPNGPQRDAGSSSGWAPEQRENQETLLPQQQQSRLSANSADIQSLKSQSQSQSQSQSLGPQRGVSYALPPGASRRVVERYSLDDNSTVSRAPSRASANGLPIGANQNIKNAPSPVPGDRSSVLPSGVQRSTSPTAGIGAGRGRINSDYPIMPLSASPSYNPPVAPKHRAYAQQPTYITPPTTLTPIKPSYSPRPPPPQEEVCVECAMRDEDMADVDVTSPGVWERESDAAFEDLKQREEEDNAKGLVTIDNPTRPRVKGGRLTEPNVKLWLSVNPREPTSRQQTLRNYIKSQRTLLEAEALAHARATQEAKQLDSRMRDTYSQLRRSAYDLGNAISPADETGGLRIKPPLSPTTPQHNTHARSQSREITLLENGMIVEHVDVRKEEREARERKRKEERRARKSSRGSTMDVTSIISANSYGVPQTDGGYGLRPHSPYSPNSARPTSVLTAPIDRPELTRAYSQASFSDFHSMGSASPRRTRFFGFKNLSAGWRSQDSLAPSAIQSGSMVDMHLALQRETQQFGMSPPELGASRRSQLWLSDQPEASETQVGDSQPDDSIPKKKKKGLAKIWGIVTGSNKQANATRRDPSIDKTEDDLPLAPPPPLSYLVNRGPSDLRAASGRHGSTPSLPSLVSPKLAGSAAHGMSPSTGPSSAIPSPASSRTSGPDVEIVEARKSAYHDDQESHLRDDTIGKPPSQRNVHPMVSEPDMRQRRSRNISPPPPIPSFASPSRPPSMMSREKSLPPLPAEATSRTPSGEPRPRTVYTYDARQLPPGSGPAHDFLPPSAPFRTPDIRRQSFGGLSNRPNLAVQTMPVNGRQQPTKFGPRYDEFGASRRSLGPLDQFRDTLPVQTPTTKRKSRFGFASLLGKKSAPREPENVDQNVPQPQHQFPLRRSGSGGLDDVANGYATSTSRHSALSTSNPQTRLSVTSRKVLEERVAQDPDFVAYRYPSNDQRLDLLR
ncbi:hypothetical protein DXG03_002063 [Asterophora parasitica]|uniref:Proteophosphoglycan ppg4 n=1 Tax=Asterophora parasitica TaxID=117018 RepID=A0A9P7G8W2_9AGAR|nr:hypothetical protein DXG03_002063 [Asterophora parasitica]